MILSFALFQNYFWLKIYNKQTIILLDMVIVFHRMHKNYETTEIMTDSEQRSRVALSFHELVICSTYNTK